METVLRFWYLLPAIALALPAAAQPSGSDVFSDLLACDPLTDPGQRLACYDSVLRQYKVRFGLLEGRADELAADRDSRRAIRPGPVSRSPLPAPAASSAGEARGRAEATPRPSAPAPARRSAMRSLQELSLPLETTVSGYNANAFGDFRLRIAEGFVFEDADGPGFSEDPTGKTVTLSRNFMGNWRLEVPGEPQPVWIRPVETGGERVTASRAGGDGGTARTDRVPAASAPRTAAEVPRSVPAAAPQRVEDLPLPLETRITGYNANSRGDFRLRIAEGFVFEDADGPGFSEDPTGKTVTLTRNFMGNWRLEVPGEPQRVWVRPVETGG